MIPHRLTRAMAFFFLFLSMGCRSFPVGSYALLEISPESPQTVIFKIDGEHIGENVCRCAPGYHEVQFCKKADFLYHSCVAREYYFEPFHRYVFKLVGNVWEIQGVRITHEENKITEK